jgi:hypothetical protein
MKKLFTYQVFVVLFLSFIGAMGFGTIVKYHYEGGEKFQFLQKPVLLISSVPINFRKIIKFGSLNIDKPLPLPKHKDKKKFEQFIEDERNSLLISSRYDYNMGRSVVDVIDLKNFKIIHTYNHDIKKMNDQVLNKKLYSNININQTPSKFRYFNPKIFEDGSLVSHNYRGPLFKIDFCSKIKWINDKKKFHHMQSIDREGNIWVGSYMNPQSKNVKKYSLKDYYEDSITKINPEGRILYVKSVNELLIENNFIPKNFAYNSYNQNIDNPFHLNDIEPALNNTEYWMRDDLFLSLRNISAIVHYRPSTNKVINYIIGPFAKQHDVDIISDKEISIFNNNQFYINNQNSEILIYNFETKKFKKLFNGKLQKENFKAHANGASQILKDKSLLVEESVHGRIIMFNNKGEKVWEYINKDKDGIISYFSFSWVIEDEKFIEKFKSLVKSEKCLN